MDSLTPEVLCLSWILSIVCFAPLGQLAVKLGDKWGEKAQTAGAVLLWLDILWMCISSFWLLGLWIRELLE